MWSKSHHVSLLFISSSSSLHPTLLRPPSARPPSPDRRASGREEPPALPLSLIGVHFWTPASNEVPRLLSRPPTPAALVVPAAAAGTSIGGAAARGGGGRGGPPSAGRTRCPPELRSKALRELPLRGNQEEKLRSSRSLLSCSAADSFCKEGRRPRGRPITPDPRRIPPLPSVDVASPRNRADLPPQLPRCRRARGPRCSRPGPKSLGRDSKGLAILDELLNEEKYKGWFDFVFVDADKCNYLNYHERVLELVRVGGVIAYDNTLWGGSVAAPPDEPVLWYLKDSRDYIVELNKALAADRRIEICQLSISDGLTLCRRLY